MKRLICDPYNFMCLTIHKLTLMDFEIDFIRMLSTVPQLLLSEHIVSTVQENFLFFADLRDRISLRGDYVLSPTPFFSPPLSLSYIILY